MGLREKMPAEMADVKIIHERNKLFGLIRYVYLTIK